MKKRTEKKTVEQIIKNAERIAFYSRVSTKEQEDKGTDVGQQFAKVTEFLDRFDKTISDGGIFSDTRSAYSKPYTDRTKFEDLLNAAERKEFDAIIVSDRDRLSRQTDEHFKIRSVLERLGIPVVIASRGELYESEDFIRTLVEDALTRLESDNISIRTKATLKSLLDNDLYIGGKPPYGYDVIKDEKRETKKQKVIGFVPTKDLKIVKDIFELYKKSETFSSIAKKLNVEKLSASRVKEIITNPIYTGYLVYHRYEADRKTFTPLNQWKWIRCPFIKEEDIVLTKEEWWLCWHKYTRTRNMRPRYLNTSYYLNDITYCHCKGKMKGRDKRTNIHRPGKEYGSRSYFCDSCKEKVNVDELNELVLNVIFKLPAPKYLTTSEVKGKITKELQDKQNEINKLRAEILWEKKNIEILNSFSKKGDIKDGLLHESQHYELLAYLLSKEDSKSNLLTHEEELRKLEAEYKKLNELMVMDKEIDAKVNSFFDIRTSSSLSDLEKRNLVLLLVEECTLITSKKVRLKIKSKLPEEYDLPL